MRGQFVSIETLLAKLDRDYKKDVSQKDVIEWSAEALQAIGVNTLYEPCIRFAKVKNFRCQLPELIHVIIQIAYNVGYNESVIVPSDVAVPEEGILIDEQGQPLQEYEIAYYRPYFDLIGEFMVGGALTTHKEKFVPVRLSNHSFFNSIVCKEPDWEHLYRNSTYEYTIADNVLKFSFEEGQVAISYLRMKVDMNGFPMIPDTYSVTTAVSKYIMMKLMEFDFYAGRQGADSRLSKAEQDWQWYCKQAGNEGLMPHGIDEWENLLHQRNYLIPQTNRYNSFFGNLSSPENRSKYLRK